MQREKLRQSELETKTKEQSRSERRKAKKEARKKRPKREKRPIRRIFPIWLRLIVIFLLAVFALIIGMVVGYTIIGDGTDPLEVLTFEFWQHVLDIIRGVE